MDLKEAREVLQSGSGSNDADERTQAQAVVDANRRATAIRSNTRDRVELITMGLEHGDWRTLGYESPHKWYAALTDMMLAAPEIRRRLVAALRAEGYSLRGIASQLVVDKNTVARDLAEVSHDGTPERVTGTDGKTYPASQPLKVMPEPAEQPASWPLQVMPEPTPKEQPLKVTPKGNAAHVREVPVTVHVTEPAGREQVIADAAASLTRLVAGWKPDMSRDTDRRAVAKLADLAAAITAELEDGHYWIPGTGRRKLAEITADEWRARARWLDGGGDG
jgi:transposase